MTRRVNQTPAKCLKGSERHLVLLRDIGFFIVNGEATGKSLGTSSSGPHPVPLRYVHSQKERVKDRHSWSPNRLWTLDLRTLDSAFPLTDSCPLVIVNFAVERWRLS